MKGTRENLTEMEQGSQAVNRRLPLTQNSITELCSGSRRLTAHLQEVVATF